MLEKLGKLVVVAVIVVSLVVLLQMATGYSGMFGVEFHMPWENVAGDVYRGVLDGVRPGLGQ